MDERDEAQSVSTDYIRAGQLNARLASQFEARMAAEAKAVADRLLAHVRSNVEDFEVFATAVERSEEFTLHDSAQVPKNQKALKIYYERAMGLLETLQDWERRPRR